MLRNQRFQIFAIALLCGALAAFSAYWMRGELVKHGLFTTKSKHIPCASEDFAMKIAYELESEYFRKSLLVPGFETSDLTIQAVPDGKWVETKLTLQCFGRASYSLRKFAREFDASDEEARAKNQKLLDVYEKRMKEIENKALLGM